MRRVQNPRSDGKAPAYSGALAVGLAIAACLIVAQFGTYFLLAGDTRLQSAATAFLLAFGALLATVVLLIAVRTARRNGVASYLSWILFAIAMLAATVGGVIDGVMAAASLDTTNAVTSDLFYFVSYGCAAAAIWELPAKRAAPRARLTAAADAGMVLLVGTVAWWLIIEGPPSSEADWTLTHALPTLMYPVGSVIMLWMVASSLGETFAASDLPCIPWMVVALVAQCSADLYYGVAVMIGTHMPGDLSNLIYMAALVLLGLTGWVRVLSGRDARLASQPPARLLRTPRWVPFVPYGAALATYGLVLVGHQSVQSIAPWWYTLVPALLTGLLLVRLGLAALENVTLYQRSRAGEARQATIIETSPDAIVLMDRDLHLLTVNQRAVDMFGLAIPADLTGLKLLDFLRPAAAESMMHDVRRVKTLGQLRDLEYRLTRPNGTEIHVEVSASVVGGLTDPRGEIVAIVRDVTERKRVQAELLQARDQLVAEATTLEQHVAERTQALTEANTQLEREVAERRKAEAELGKAGARLRHLLTASPAIIFSCEPVSPYPLTFISDNVSAILGFTAQEMLADPSFWTRLVHADDLPTLFERVAQMRTHDSADYESRFCNAHGDYQWAHSEMRLVRHPDGEPSEVVGYIIDITAQKHAEQAIERYTRRLETMHSIDRATLTARSLDELAPTTLGHIRGLIPARWMAIATIEPDAQQGVVVALDGMPGTSFPDSVACGSRLSLTDIGVVDEMLLSDPDYIPNLATSPRSAPLLEMLRRLEMQSYLCLPLRMGQDLMGVLSMGANQPYAFTPEHIDIAQEAADLLAIAMHQAQLRAALQHYNADLEERVARRTAELENAYAKLQNAAARLEELDRMKSQFVSNVSHELRTPLANIKLYLSLLERGKPEKHDQYMATLNQETKLLQTLIEDLLHLSRLDTGRVQPNLTPTDINALVQALVANRYVLVVARGLRLETRLVEGLPLVQADARLLTQILTNLITNATNYTPAPGEITISTALAQSDGREWVAMSVRDTGVGISPEDQKRLFERFHRGEAARSTGAPGTGLGLAISDEIIRRHDGKITVQSRVGEGSTFTVWLPVPA